MSKGSPKMLESLAIQSSRCSSRISSSRFARATFTGPSDVIFHIGMTLLLFTERTHSCTKHHRRITAAIQRKLRPLLSSVHQTCMAGRTASLLPTTSPPQSLDSELRSQRRNNPRRVEHIGLGLVLPGVGFCWSKSSRAVLQNRYQTTILKS